MIIKYTGYFLPKVEIEDYNVVFNWRNFFDQPIKNYKITYGHIQKIATEGDDYTSGYLLDYTYFKYNYKLISIYF